jgi:hypothetical protein
VTASLSLGPLLKIVKTRTVEVEYAEQFAEFVLFGLGRRAAQQRTFWSIWEVDNIAEVPTQGTPIVPERNWRPVTRVKRIAPITETLQKAAIDIVYGALPVVGDALDISELIYGIITGEDRWGEPLTPFDLSVMAIGAMLPFVSSSALRRGESLIRRFGDQAGEAAELIDRLRRAGLSAEETDLIRSMDTLIVAGRKPTAEMWQQYSGLLRRFGGEPPTLDLLLNAERNGFIHAEIQEAYQSYRQTALRRGEVPADPEVWARRQTVGRWRDILVKILGLDYARRAGTAAARPVNLVDIPRPTNYTGLRYDEDLQSALGNSSRLKERLSAVFDGYCQINSFCADPRDTEVREQSSSLLGRSLCCGNLSPDLTSICHLQTIVSGPEPRASGTEVRQDGTVG